MKRCSRCGETKPLDDFHRRTKSPDGRQGMCKACNRAQRSAHYRTAHGRAGNLATGKRNRASLRQSVWDYLAAHPCVDCGEADPIVLEFDHRDPAAKRFNIGTAVHKGYGWPRILAEIAKCDVRCANCHRRRTALQFDWHIVRGAGVEPATNAV